MNTYEMDIWSTVKHNGEFSHTATRVQFVHALNEERARKKVKLAGERTINSGAIPITASSETIYAIRKTGTVLKKLMYVYSDGRSPRPVR